MKTVKIHKAVGECITAREFALIVAPMVGQTVSAVEYALDFITDELGMVEGMEVYCETCGLTAI